MSDVHNILHIDGLVDQTCLELKRHQQIVIRLGRYDADRTQKQTSFFNIEPSVLVANLRHDAIIKLSWKLSDQGFVLH